MALAPTNAEDNPSTICRTHEDRSMSVSREQIPWYPTIEQKLCTNCGICVDFCKHGVYAVEDVRTTVVAPYNCVVGCSGCESQCTAAAISFPDMQEFLVTLREIRARYGQ